MQNKLCKPQISLNINNKHLHFPFLLVISSDVLVSHKQQWKRGQFYVFRVLSMSFIHSVFNTRQLFIDNNFFGFIELSFNYWKILEKLQNAALAESSGFTSIHFLLFVLETHYLCSMTTHTCQLDSIF